LQIFSFLPEERFLPRLETEVKSLVRTSPAKPFYFAEYICSNLRLTDNVTRWSKNIKLYIDFIDKEGLDTFPRQNTFILFSCYSKLIAQASDIPAMIKWHNKLIEYYKDMPKRCWFHHLALILPHLPSDAIDLDFWNRSLLVELWQAQIGPPHSIKDSHTVLFSCAHQLIPKLSAEMQTCYLEYLERLFTLPTLQFESLSALESCFALSSHFTDKQFSDLAIRINDDYFGKLLTSGLRE
jgi:hypothetical protein